MSNRSRRNDYRNAQSRARVSLPTVTERADDSVYGRDIENRREDDMSKTGRTECDRKLKLNTNIGRLTEGAGRRRPSMLQVVGLAVIGLSVAWLIWTMSPTTWAAAPVISIVNPGRNALHISPTTNISVTFNGPVDPLTIDNATFRVWGNQSGLHTSANITSDSVNNIASFDPDEDFLIGEWVNITLTTGIKNLAGEPLSTPFNWTFRIKTLDGGGLFGDPSVPGCASFPRSMAVGDLDGDGDLDLAETDTGPKTVTILRNDGSGTFGACSSQVLVDNPRQLIAGDLDSDGDMDLAVVIDPVSGVMILKNDGTGNFDQSSTVSLSSGAFSIAAGDLDGDGDTDLAVGHFSQSALVSILLNDGTSSFALGSTLVVPAPYALIAGDVDNDGDLDLVASVTGNNRVHVLKNSGSAVFVQSGQFVAGTLPRHLTSGDFDGDGDLDVAVANNISAGTINVLKNDGTGVLSATTLSAGFGPWGITSADVDGDGDLDLALANGSGIIIYTNNGLGTFSQFSTVSAPGAEVFITSGDFDGDGDLDLAETRDGGRTLKNLNVAIGFTAASSSVAENAGTAQVTVVVTTPDGAPTTSPVSADFAASNETALAGSDYNAVAGTISFPIGTPSGATVDISIAIIDDLISDPNETFRVVLSNPSGGLLGANASNTVTILDDDPLPLVSVNDLTVSETAAGDVNALFTVQLSTASGASVSLEYATSDGTAVSGSDYVSSSGTLTFPPGTVTQTVVVVVKSDGVSETDEHFFINLTNPSNAIIGDGQGACFIVNLAPSANSQAITTSEDNPAVVVLTGSDPEGDSLTFTITSPPANGVLNGTLPTVTYTPALNFNGSDSFTFQVSDGFLNSATATVSITITAVNDPPTISSFTATPSSGTAPLLVAFNLAASDVDGAIASVDWDFDGNGVTDQTTTAFSTTFTYATGGVFNVRATVVDDGGAVATATQGVLVADFALSSSPASQQVNPGNSTIYTISATSLAGFNSPVNLSVSASPSPTQLNVELGPNPIVPTATAFLTVNTVPSTPLGSYTLTVTGSSGGLTRMTTVTLVVTTAQLSPDFSLLATPPSQSVVQSAAFSTGVSTEINVLSLNGFSDPVSLSASGLPAGAAASFSVNPVSPTALTQLSVIVPANVLAGAYAVTITGTSGATSHNASVTLNIVPAPVSGNTPLSGEPVSVAIGSGVTVTYSSVTSAGATSVITSTNGSPPPAGFKLAGVFYDISTTAVFGGKVIVCINYAESANEQNFRLLHREGNNWVNVTLPGYPDTAANIICGEVSSFSEFAVMEMEPLITGGGQSSTVDQYIAPVAVTFQPSGRAEQIADRVVTLPPGTTRIDVSYSFGPGATPSSLSVTFNGVELLAAGTLNDSATGVVIRGLAPLTSRNVLTAVIGGTTSNAKDRDRLTLVFP